VIPAAAAVAVLLRANALCGGRRGLVTTDFKTVRVEAPNVRSGNVIRGTGWTLKLAPGYRMVADPQRSGSYTVLK
jgi:hypothetical protein